MEYGIRELSELAGVSARTLRYYDEIRLLKPLYVNDAGYRFYGEREVAILQQILFYRERGFDLKSIRQILYQEDFDLLEALKEHLANLQEQRDHMDALIRTVEQTILSVKGERKMSDREKFEAFKTSMVEENEERYGAEIRERYGDEQIDASNQKLLKMSLEEWTHFKGLEEEILQRLQKGVRAGILPDSQEAGKIVKLHREWLAMTWKQYSAKAHEEVAKLYTADERFTGYYDKEVAGCAELLKQAILFWAEKEK